jgi:TRAP-type mannitol/chloroaromatic compound transport system permease small subunit
MMTLSQYLNFQCKVSEWVGKAISWMCLAMIIVLGYEVSARYLFNAPTSWAHESTTMLYGTFCILAGVYTHRYHGHVRSEVVYNLFPMRVRALMDCLTGALGLVVLTVFFMITFRYAADSWAIKEISSKSTWAPIIYPFKSVLPLAIGLMILQSIAHFIESVAGVFDISIKQRE